MKKYFSLLLLVVVPLSAYAQHLYPIVDTGQTSCFNATQQIACPAKGLDFFGQDAQYLGNVPNYQISKDGKTVFDTVTRLVWTRIPDTNMDGQMTYDDKLTVDDAKQLPTKFNNANYGGYSDWRLPTIKELYSLIEFSGIEPRPDASTTDGAKPFIDTTVFTMPYGFLERGERIIDSQVVSINPVLGSGGIFGVNFIDGRLKGYGANSPSSTSNPKRFIVMLVRGNPAYGKNEFQQQSGGVSDAASGLFWQQGDSTVALDWQHALSYVQEKNASKYLGFSDWRLPNAKELQSIVDYRRGPNVTNSPALDPIFKATPITNEAGNADWPWYWTSTTHGTDGVYVAFGRALGYVDGRWQDVHGAGAQRTDPKTGSPDSYPTGAGPQGDAKRIENYVRMVRGGGATITTKTDVPSKRQAGMSAPPLPTVSNAQQPIASLDVRVAACANKAINDLCAFSGTSRVVSGTCMNAPSGAVKSCVPISVPSPEETSAPQGLQTIPAESNPRPTPSAIDSVSACAGRANNDACTFSGMSGPTSGVCSTIPPWPKSCMPIVMPTPAQQPAPQNGVVPQGSLLVPSLSACFGRAVNDVCAFQTSQYIISGICNDTPRGVVACVPIGFPALKQ